MPRAAVPLGKREFYVIEELSSQKLSLICKLQSPIVRFSDLGFVSFSVVYAAMPLLVQLVQAYAVIRICIVCFIVLLYFYPCGGGCTQSCIWM